MLTQLTSEKNEKFQLQKYLHYTGLAESRILDMGWVHLPMKLCGNSKHP